MLDTYDILLVRVDNRLVHGQLIEAWIPHLKAEVLIIVNDEISGDIFRETVIRMAVPQDITVNIHSLDEFADSYLFDTTSGKKTIVLFCNILDAVHAYRRGFRYVSLNLGNIYCDECVLSCSRSVSLSKTDFEELTDLCFNNGVKVDVRGLPGDKPIDFHEFI